MSKHSMRARLIHVRQSIEKFWSRSIRQAGDVAHPLILRFRWKVRLISRKRRKVAPAVTVENIFERLDIWYINLDRRADRRTEIEAELRGIGAGSWSRFPAIDALHQSEATTMPRLQASIACGLSHIATLNAASRKHEAVMICEDDLQFVQDTEGLAETIDEFLFDNKVDVLCLAANVFDTPLPVSSRMAISQHVITAACYLVKTQHVEKVQNNFATAVRRLEQTQNVQVYSIDQFWRKIQRTGLIFAVPNNPESRFAFQSGSKSDILQRPGMTEHRKTGA